MELLAFNSLSYYWNEYVWGLLLFVLGLGLVVFVHELGHFIVAKWVGIRVDRFAFGFGKRLFGFKIGETDYCINAVPLGGYVKMLGQEDFKPLSENDKPDPRAYDQKSVGVRFAVISAGVIMNVILAAVLFVIVGMVGRASPAPVIGGFTPGMPAAEATITWQTPLPSGATTRPTTAPTTWVRDPWSPYLQPGDRITKLEGDSYILTLNRHRISSMQDVQMTSILAYPQDKYAFTIERTIDGVKRVGTADVGVRVDDGKLVFGVGAAGSNVVDGEKQMIRNILPFKSGDEVIAINGQSVQDLPAILRASVSLTGEPAKVTVKRDGQEIVLTVPAQLTWAPGVLFKKDGSAIPSDRFVSEPDKDEYKVLLGDGSTQTVRADEVGKLHYPERLNILGMNPRLMIAGIVTDGPAERAGLKVGDIVASYADTESPNLEAFLKINEDLLDKGGNMQVIRDGKLLDPLKITPEKVSGQAQVGTIPAADLQHLVVAGVAKKSPAAEAGIERNSTIETVNGKPVKTWVELYNALAANQGKKVAIGYKTGNATRTANIDLTPKKFDPDNYAFSIMVGAMNFRPLMVTIKQTGPLASIKWGARETIKDIISSYVSLRSLVMGHASMKHMAGPVGLAAISVEMGRRPLIDFVYFIAFISAAIAVFNFLPLPVVDGGHAVFLLIEKIRGKPVSMKVMNITQAVGLVLLLGVFLAVTANDIRRIISGS